MTMTASEKGDMALQDMAFEAFDSNVKADADFCFIGRDGTSF
jgi:hypothetical protein